jgi:hypothetical protein
MENFKVGDKIKIIKQSWGMRELVGMTGEIIYIDYHDQTYSIYFKGWDGGHACAANPKYAKIDCFSVWDFRDPRTEKDIFVKANTQLEFDFKKEIKE